MKLLLKLLATFLVGIIELIFLAGSLIGTVVYYIFSAVTGMASICAVWAWLIGDHMGPIFLEIALGFFLLIIAGSKLFKESAGLIVTMKQLIKIF
jgi:hypothetical protein